MEPNTAPRKRIFDLLLGNPSREALAQHLNAGGLADVNTRGEGGITPLMVAAYLGREDLVADLLLAGAEKGARDDAGADAFNYRLYGQNLDVATRATAHGWMKALQEAVRPPRE